MPYYKFEENDIIYNTVEVNPKVEFFVFNKQTFLNNAPRIDNKSVATVDHRHTSEGFVSLHELNINRETGNLIYPFITKNGSLTAFKTVSTESYNQDFKYGDTLTGSYPLTASITKEYFSANHVSSTYAHDNDDGKGSHILSLKNTLDHYKNMSLHYAYSASIAPGSGDLASGWDKGVQPVGLLSIPSIFYGTEIERGSVELNFYATGSLIGSLRDDGKNGELIQVGPTGSTGSGSVAGVVLYNEGFIVLTGSWDLSNGEHTDNYLFGGGADTPKWTHFAAGANDKRSGDVTGSSFHLSFNGTSKIPTMTMFTRAEKGKLNHSNNVTYIESGQTSGTYITPSLFQEKPQRIKNIISGAYTDATASFQKQTFISSVGIYDKDKNLIGIAKLATPVQKREERNYTFKLKIDV